MVVEKLGGLVGDFPDFTITKRDISSRPLVQKMRRMARWKAECKSYTLLKPQLL